MKKLINAQVVRQGKFKLDREEREKVIMMVMKLEMVLYLNNVMECCFFVPISNGVASSTNEYRFFFFNKYKLRVTVSSDDETKNDCARVCVRKYGEKYFFIENFFGERAVTQRITLRKITSPSTIHVIHIEYVNPTVKYTYSTYNE